MSAKKILICDDEPNIVESVSYIVKKEGHQFFVAENGKFALELARREKPDVMILDVRMPNLTGNQVCEILKSDVDTRGIHIIMLTAYGQPQDHDFSMACGADEFMAKPFSPRELGARIKQILSPELGA